MQSIFSRMKTLFALALCGLLCLSARAQPTTGQLIDYVRDAWQITDLTDNAIASTLDTSYSSIPFKDWINGLDTAAQVNEQLRKQNYGAAAKIAAEFGNELGFNRLLAAVGLDGVSSVASLAVWPIDHALNAVVDTVKQKTFRDQCARYFAARTLNTAEEIRDAAPFDPLDADVNGGTLYKDQRGWLIRVTSDTTSASVLGFDSAAQFYELAEKIWQAREQTQNLADDSREVASAFRQAATPSAPVITSSPTAQTITEGETATFSVVASGSGTLTYLWRRDGELVDGATDSGFTTGVAGCYQAEVVNAVGSAFSHTACLTVQPVQPVSLTAPSAGTTLAGSVSVRASANGATKVEFWLDGVRKSTDNTSPYTWSWDTTSSADGAHELVAKAFSGTTLLDSTPARTVKVDNTSAGDCSDATEPNNSSTTGTWLPVGTSTNAYICTASDVDWFRIPVTAAGLINITVIVPAGLDYELELYGPDGAWQAGSYRSAGQTETISFNSYRPGTYYARVYGYPIGTGSHSGADDYTIAVQGDLASGMVVIPAGSFTMGDTMSDGYAPEIPAHTLYVSAFRMDANLVTKALWERVCQWATTRDYAFDYAGTGKRSDHPVQRIDWYDAVKWCNARSEQEGLTPCYFTDATHAAVYRSGQIDLANDSVNWNANGYRLPTEAEWEKAARGGLAGRRFPWGDTISEGQANYYSGMGYAYDLSSTGYNPAYNDGVMPYTSPVGAFAANGYGLFDMAGNTAEWCWDWYDQDWYGTVAASQNDTRGPGKSVNMRVMRGGTWALGPHVSRAAFRNNYYPYPLNGGFDFGFRCARLIAQNMSTNLTTGLVAYYPFDGNANDASGNGNDGSAHGTTLAMDRFGQANSAFSFDGVANYVAIPNNSSLNLTTSFTLSAWIYQNRSDPQNGYRIVDKCPAGQPSGWTFDTWDGATGHRLRLQGAGPGSYNVSGSTAYSVMQWHHVVATVSGASGAVYLDGNLDGTGNVGSLPSNSLDIFIGCGHTTDAWPLAEYFSGLIDDVHIYNRALSAGEVQELYNSTDGQQISGTIMLNVQPASHRASLGDSTVFSVSASGTGVLGYQWQRNGRDIPGATNSTYTTPQLSLADSGTIYLVRVTNAFDSIFSAPAVLTVTVPRISNARLSSGSAIQFDVNSDDTRPHVIEGTTDLLHWSPVVTNTPVNGFFEFSDVAADGPQRRFYRIVIWH